MRLVVAAAGLCGAGEHVRAGGRIQPGSAGTARGRRAGLMAGGCGVAVPGAGSAHSRGVSGIGGVLVIRPGMTVYARRCRRRPAGGSCAPAGARACGSRSRLPRPAWIGPGWIGPGWRAGRGRSAAGRRQGPGRLQRRAAVCIRPGHRGGAGPRQRLLRQLQRGCRRPGSRHRQRSRARAGRPGRLAWCQLPGPVLSRSRRRAPWPGRPAWPADLPARPRPRPGGQVS
jgi:hypothetical protein